MLQRLHENLAALALCPIMAITACAGSAARTIPRTLGGSAVPGVFVPPSAYEAYIRGELYLAEGRTREARAQFELASTAPDEDAYLLSRLAYAELMDGDLVNARRTLDHAAKLDRCAEAVWLTRGAIAESERDAPKAARAYEQASECAPRSALGELALARLLKENGHPVAALDVLVRAAGRPYAARVEPTLQRSLRDADPATFAHALDSLSAVRAPSSSALEQAIRVALERKLPRLSLRLAEAHKAALPAELEAALLVEAGSRSELAALLAQHDADDLCGRERTALLALAAGAYERAELEAASALSESPSDAMHAVRARAALGLSQRRQALAEIARVGDRALRRTLLLETLASSGAAALASELATKPLPTPKL